IVPGPLLLPQVDAASTFVFTDPPMKLRVMSETFTCVRPGMLDFAMVSAFWSMVVREAENLSFVNSTPGGHLTLVEWLIAAGSTLMSMSCDACVEKGLPLSLPVMV